MLTWVLVTVSVFVQEQELEAMKARLADMEKEAAKLKEMQVGRPAEATLQRCKAAIPVKFYFLAVRTVFVCAGHLKRQPR